MGAKKLIHTLHNTPPEENTEGLSAFFVIWTRNCTTRWLKQDLKETRRHLATQFKGYSSKGNFNRHKNTQGDGDDEALVDTLADSLA